MIKNALQQLKTLGKKEFSNKKVLSEISMMALERRIMLDAAMVAGIHDAVANDDLVSVNAYDAQDSSIETAKNTDDFIDIARDHILEKSHENNKNVSFVIIDDAIQNHANLSQDLLKGYDVIAQHDDLSLLQKNSDFIVHITIDEKQDIQKIEQLSEKIGQEIDAVHIYTHGRDGTLILGGETVNTANTDLLAFMKNIEVGSDMLLYGCSIAESDHGMRLIKTLHENYNIDVAASNNTTSLATDWTLEKTAGTINTAEIQPSEWQGSLSGTPIPSASVIMPILENNEVANEHFINESFDFSVTFDNAATGNNPGYAPFFDLVYPAEFTINGDGSAFGGNDTPRIAVATWDGSNWISVADGTTVITEHPLGSTVPLPTPPTAAAGWVWDYATLPFGSFTADQPPVDVVFNASMNKTDGARVGTAMDVQVTPGFSLGCDPLNNPGTDPAIVGTPLNTPITPTVMIAEKEALVPEDGEAERATGPSFPFTYQIIIDIADGETIEDFNFLDTLPNNIVYQNNVTVTGPAAPGSFTIINEPGTTAPENGATVELDLGDVTGTASDQDLIITYQAFVPEFDANGSPVVPPASGAPTTSTNTVTVSGDYDVDGDGTTDTTTSTSDTEVFSPHSFATQKTVAVVGGGIPAPGATMEWTITTQISDFFRVGNITFDDVLADGQSFDTGFAPTLSVTENGVTTSGTFDPANFTQTLNFGTGETDIEFRLSDELVFRGQDGIIDGDLAVDTNSDGGSTVTIVFRSIINDNYLATGPDFSIDAGDIIRNDVTTNGTIFDDAGTPTGVLTDDAAEVVQLADISAAKSLYAINGVINPTDTELRTGDVVTFRLTFTIPIADLEDFSVDDFFPLPIFDVNEFSGVVGSTPGPSSATPPPTGQIIFGPNHNLPGTLSDTYDPIISINTDQNSVSLSPDSIEDPTNPAGPFTIEVLMSATVQDAFFADNLLFTNQAQAMHQNTTSVQFVDDAITQVTVRAPELELTKGTVSTTNTAGVFDPTTVGPAGVTFSTPGVGGASFTGTIDSAGLDAIPIDSDLDNIDAGDLVKFAIVVENTGGRSAFDVNITDVLPPDFAIPTTGPGLNLQVTDGDGNAIPFTGSLFGAGLELTDAVAQGAINSQVNANTNGDASNVLIITYDLLATTAVVPDSLHINDANLNTYSALEGGMDYTAGNTGPWDDTAEVEITAPTIAKRVISTSINTPNNTLETEATIGEEITYQITVTLPEGTHPVARITDTLPTNLSFVSLDSVVASSGDVSFTPPTPPASGVTGALTFNFGTVVNNNTDNSTSETITLTYTALVNNSASNNAGNIKANLANYSWDDPAIAGRQTTGNVSDSVRILEPRLNTTKAVAIVGPQDQADQVTYTITIAHTSPTSINSTDAFDVLLTDNFPAEVTGLSIISAQRSDGLNLVPSLTLAGNNLTTNPGGFDLLLGQTATIIVQGTIDTAIEPGTVVTNTATSTWTSIDGTDPNERDGSGGINDYTDNGVAAFTTDIPDVTKTLVSTSVNDGSVNQLSEVVVGETATYQVVARVTEGTTTDFVIQDTLPTGLSFVSLDSVVATPPLTSSIGAFNTVTPPAVGATGAINFDFDTVVNSDTNNATDETITLTYTVLVDNVAAVQDGVTLSNAARVVFNGTATAPSAVDVDVIEPVLDVNKSILAVNPPGINLPADANDVVQYNIQITHDAASSAHAFDLNLTDAVPSELDNVTLISATINPGGIDVTASFAVAGNNLTTIGDVDLLIGQTLDVVIQGAIIDNITPNTVITNTANLIWTSLDGVDANERDGSGGVNDYNDTNAINFNTARPSFDKVIVDTSVDSTTNDETEVVIGESVTYDLRLTLTEGLTQNVRFSDTLPTGMQVVSAQILTSSGDITTDIAGGFASVTVPSAGDTGNFTVNMGNVTNSNTDNAVDEVLTLRIVAIVEDDASLNSGSTLTNAAELVYVENGSDITPLTDNETVTVIEPVLQAEKNFISVSGIGEAGDLVTYSIIISHAPGSDTDAHDLVITDTLPPELSGMNLVSATLTDGANPPINITSDFTITGGTTLSSNANAVDLPFGETITIVITATINTVPAGLTVTNQVDVGWDSFPEDNPQGIDRDDTTSDTADFVTAVPTWAKNTISTSIVSGPNSNTEAVIGETILYEVNLGMTQGILSLAEIVDTLDPGLQFLAIESVTVPGSVTSSTLTPINVANLNAATTVSPAPGGDVITIDLGNLTNSDTDPNTAENLVIQYRVLVENDVVNQNGVAVNNSAVFNWDVDGDPGTADGETRGPVSAPPVNIIEPDLQVTKTVDNPTPNMTETIEYTIVIEHTGASTADAHDIVFTDTVPAALTLDVGSINVVGATIVNNTSAGNNINLELDTLALTTPTPSTITITFEAEVNLTPANVGQTITNTGDITWTSLPGVDANERDGSDGEGGALDDYADSEDEDITILDVIDLNIDKDDAGATAVAGNNLTYNLVVTNTSGVNATGVVITETVPLHVTSVDATNVTVTGWVLQSGSGGPGSVYTFNVGTLNAGNNVSVPFTVLVDDPIPAGVDTLSNTASVTDDGTNGTDPTPGNNTDTEPTPLDAAPDYTITKDDGETNIEPGDSITYNIQIENVGTQDGTGVVITDTYDPALLLNPVPSPGGTVGPAGTITWNIGNLNVLAVENVSVTFDVVDPMPAGIDDITNVAEVTDDGNNGPDPTPADNIDDDVDIVDAAPDYVLIKDDSLTELVPGQNFTYTINIQNVGNQNGTGVVVTDTYDPTLLLNPVPSAGGVVGPAGTITWNIGSMAAGANQNLTVTFDVVNPAPAGIDDITNSASITDDGANGPDPTPANNTDDDTDTLNAFPDYVLTKDDGVTTVEPGDIITYTINVENVGDQDGTGIVITDTYDPALLLSPVPSAGGTVGPAGTITWNIPTLAGGGGTTSVNVQFTVVDPAPAGLENILNTASVTDDGNNGADPTPDNNTDDDDDIVEAQPDYEVTKTNNETVLVPGQTTTYTITITNKGNQNGTGVVVTDTYDPAILLNPIISGGGTPTAPGEITWNIGNLNVGQTETFTVTFDVVDPAPAGVDDITNAANITDDGNNGPDPTPEDNDDEDIDPLDAVPDYEITKTNNITMIEPGDVFTYELTITNKGNQNGTGVVVIDTFDPTLLLNPTPFGIGTVTAPGELTWNIGDLDVGEVLTLTAQFTLINPVPSGLEDVLNFASIDDDGNNGPDPTPEDNEDEDGDPVEADPIYVVTKDDGRTAVAIGEEYSYTITAENIGNQNGTGVVITDTFNPLVIEILDPNGGVVDNVAGTITWNIGDLNVGDFVSITIDVKIVEDVDLGKNEFAINDVVLTDDGANGNPIDNPEIFERASDSDTDIILGNALPFMGDDDGDLLHYDKELMDSDLFYHRHHRLISLETMDPYPYFDLDVGKRLAPNLVGGRSESPEIKDRGFGEFSTRAYYNNVDHDDRAPVEKYYDPNTSWEVDWLQYLFDGGRGDDTIQLDPDIIKQINKLADGTNSKDADKQANAKPLMQDTIKNTDKSDQLTEKKQKSSFDKRDMSKEKEHNKLIEESNRLKKMQEKDMDAFWNMLGE